MKYQEKLARLWETKGNSDYFESTIGKVLTPPPKLTISIWSGEVVLEASQLYMNDRLFDDHTRKFRLEGEVKNQKMMVSSSTMTKAGQGPHEHILQAWEGSGNYAAEGTIVSTDTLRKGDLVKLTPTESGQIWFVDYKVRRLGGE